MTQDFYGVKRVTAWREDKTKVSPDDTSYTEEGYAVKYADGYTSWSPKDTFEAAYKPITAMGFEGALAAMKAGHRVTRPKWEYPIGLDNLRGIQSLHFGTESLLAEDWMIVE